MLALLLLLDQFPRNMFRGTPRAFESDAKARAIWPSAGAGTVFRPGAPVARTAVLHLPLEHSEDLADQKECVRLNEKLAYDDYLDYAVQHHDIIACFGRFPHRNHILGRESSSEEQEFLKTHKGF